MEGQYKLNTDSASHGKPGKWEGGGLVRDSFDNTIFGFHESLGLCTKMGAETKALKWCLNMYS